MELITHLRTSEIMLLTKNIQAKSDHITSPILYTERKLSELEILANLFSKNSCSFFKEFSVFLVLSCIGEFSTKRAYTNSKNLVPDSRFNCSEIFGVVNEKIML